MLGRANVPQWTVTGESTANAAKTITKAADTALTHYVTAVSVCTKGAAPGADITIYLKDNTTIVWSGTIPNTSLDNYTIQFPHPIAMTKGNKIDLVVGAGGTGCITVNNIAGFSV